MMTYPARFTTPLGCDSEISHRQVEEMLTEGEILEQPGCVRIETERLCLREARLSDLDTLHAVWSNDDVMRYWYGTRHQTRIPIRIIDREY